jgi:hypothetical protein
MNNEEYQELINIIHEIKKDLKELRLIVNKNFEKDEKAIEEFKRAEKLAELKNAFVEGIKSNTTTLKIVTCKICSCKEVTMTKELIDSGLCSNCYKKK